MSVKLIIPKIIYNSLESLLPIPKKIQELNPFFNPHKQRKSTEKKALAKDVSPEQKGHYEHVQNERMEKEDAKVRMDRLMKKSNRRIMSIDAFSFIPFGLFKNTIEVEESRVIFIFKQPFTFQSHTLDISDISNVFIESALLFASMRIVSRTYIQNDIHIGYLNKNKAEKIRRTIEGLRTFAHAKIDTSNYEIDELLQKLEELHTMR